MSLSLILPLKSDNFGYKSFEDSETIDAIKQNLKMLLLTRPGEYVMDPDFGVGVQNYLFYQEGSDIISQLSSRINQQVQKYMPYVGITNLQFNTDELVDNKLSLRIDFLVSDSDLIQVFELIVEI